MNRTRIAVLALAVGLVGVSPASADIYTQTRSGSSSFNATEFGTGVGGTPISTPAVTLDGFDTQGGTRTLVGVDLLTSVVFEGVRLEVLNVSPGSHGPLQAEGESGIGATVGSQFPFLQPITPWVADPIDGLALPGFGTSGLVDLVFRGEADLSGVQPLSFYEQSASFDVFAAAVLDARSITSPDGSLVPMGSVNPVSEWTITIETTVAYRYELVPTPGAATLLGMACVVSFRRRR